LTEDMLEKQSRAPKIRMIV